MKTLEEYLKENYKNIIIDHSIRATVNSEGVVSFYIHPYNKPGETLDFIVVGNKLLNNNLIK